MKAGGNELQGNEIVTKYRLTGVVQGVGFRRYLQEIAIENDVCGWAENEQDGSLIVFLKGKEGEVIKMHSLLQQGPPLARVITATALQVEEKDNLSSSTFVVR